MRKKRTSNALKGIASCMICAWSLCACGNVAEDSSDRKVRDESKAADYEALFDEIEAITPYKSLSNTNPIMTQRFGADPYAMVYKDRVYFYMTGDTFEYDADGSVTENTYGKINTISVVSTTDMVNFEDHGTVHRIVQMSYGFLILQFWWMMTEEHIFILAEVFLRGRLPILGQPEWWNWEKI